MKVKRKPPLNTFSAVTAYCIAAALFLCGGRLILHGISDIDRYDEVQNNIVTVTAVGHSIIEVNNDGDLDYKLYVTFSYEGNSYTVYYRTYDKLTTAQAELGKTVDLAVNPEKPSEQPDDIFYDALWKNLTGGALFGFGVIILCGSKRKLYTQVFGWSEEYIEMDIRRKHCEPIAVALGFLAMGVCWLPVILVSPWDNVPPGLLLLVVILMLIIGVRNLLQWLADWKKIREGKYTVTSGTLIDRKIEYRDESMVYVLYYSDGEHIWQRDVSYNNFVAAKSGDLSKSVFLEGAKKPILVKEYEGSERPEKSEPFFRT